MNSIVGRLVFCVAAMGFSASIFGCAEGAPAAPVNDIPAPVVVEPPKCGNGKMDMLEMCECPPGASTQCKVDGVTCAMLMNGATGTLLCDAKTCTFVTSMCMNGALGGSGAAGASH